MRISSLEQYGIPKMLIDAWVGRFGDELLPLQERAVADYGLLCGGSLVVSAPTSSGKTFCAELAAAHVLAERRKVVFLVPLKALAEERFTEFDQKYRELGVGTVVSTSDHTENDRRIEAGDFDILITVYEKFNQALLRNIDLLGSVDLLIVDELQMLGDESRGATLELLLLKVLNSPYRCRVIGLSAVLGNAQKLADWVGARLMTESRRPVELRQGVLFRNELRYSCFNSGEEGIEEMAVLGEAASPTDVLLENVARLVESGEQVLVFVRSRGSCVRMSKSLARRVPQAECRSAQAELSQGDDGALSRDLAGVLGHGIAFHNSDLSHHQREVIEKFYLSGEIRVIIATTTLSLGLNLPAQTVFMETYKYSQGAMTGQPWIERLSWSDYENMGGRAGRLKFRPGFGRSIVVAGGRLEREMLWHCFVHGSPEELEGRLFSREMCDVVLDLAVSRCVTDRSGLIAVLSTGFSSPAADVRDLIEGAVAKLCECGMISESAGVPVPSAYGEKVVRLGLVVSTGLHLRKLFDSCAENSELVWIYELCDTHEGNRLHIPRGISEDAERGLFARFISLVRDGGSAPEGLSRMFEHPDRIEEAVLSRIRLSLALRDWIRGAETSDIESRYRIYAGTIQAAGNTVAWLAEAAYALMGVLGYSLKRRVPLRRMSYEVRFGLPVATRKLYLRFRELVSRKEMLLLHKNGAGTVRGFLYGDRKLISDLIGGSKVERMMAELVGNALSATGDGPGTEAAQGDGGIKLWIAGIRVRDRYRVTYFGRPVLLTAKSFKYLMKLAAQRSLDGAGWIDKEDLEPGFNQARYLYNLKKELGGSVTDGRELIENDRQGRYRLGLGSDDIRFDHDSLTRLEDHELAELSKRLV